MQRANLYDMCMLDETSDSIHSVDCKFCTDEYPENDLLHANELFAANKPAGIRRGDLVRFGREDYRNQGKFIYDGEHLVELDHETNDYGCIPKEFPVTEFGNSQYFMTADDYNGDMVWVDIHVLQTEYKWRETHPVRDGYNLYTYVSNADPADKWYILAAKLDESRDHYSATDSLPASLRDHGVNVPLERLLLEDY